MQVKSCRGYISLCTSKIVWLLLFSVPNKLYKKSHVIKNIQKTYVKQEIHYLKCVKSHNTLGQVYKTHIFLRLSRVSIVLLCMVKLSHVTHWAIQPPSKPPFVWKLLLISVFKKHNYSGPIKTVRSPTLYKKLWILNCHHSSYYCILSGYVRPLHYLKHYLNVQVILTI